MCLQLIELKFKTWILIRTLIFSYMNTKHNVHTCIVPETLVLNHKYLNKIALQQCLHDLYHHCDAFWNWQLKVCPHLLLIDLTVAGSKNCTYYYIVRFICPLDISVYVFSDKELKIRCMRCSWLLYRTGQSEIKVSSPIRNLAIWLHKT